VQDIPTQVVALAKEKSKEMPVILFCSNIEQYNKLISEAKVFVGNEVGVLLAVLENLRESKDAIVITTSRDSKGVDFLFEVS
jgi:late competence protein required for DNA uptake (superfamily II DNA/RNA helicase)